MKLKDIEEIYKKLSYYKYDFKYLSEEEINKYLKIKRDDIKDIIKDKNIENFTKRKILYISSDKVVDLEIGKYVEMVRENIFKYKDMKIVVKNG